MIRTLEQKFVDVVGEIAVEDWRIRRICLPSLTVALAIEGTEWGRTRECISRNELFPHRRDKHKEQYNSLFSAVCSHNNYLAAWQGKKQEEPNWKALIGEENYVLAVQYLQDAQYPYYASKEYAAKLIELIEKYKLTKFDEMKRRKEYGYQKCV